MGSKSASETAQIRQIEFLKHFLLPKTEQKNEIDQNAKRRTY